MLVLMIKDITNAMLYVTVLAIHTGPLYNKYLGYVIYTLIPLKYIIKHPIYKKNYIGFMYHIVMTIVKI